MTVWDRDERLRLEVWRRRYLPRRTFKWQRNVRGDRMVTCAWGFLLWRLPENRRSRWSSAPTQESP